MAFEIFRASWTNDKRWPLSDTRCWTIVSSSTMNEISGASRDWWWKLGLFLTYIHISASDFFSEKKLPKPKRICRRKRTSSGFKRFAFTGFYIVHNTQQPGPRNSRKPIETMKHFFLIEWVVHYERKSTKHSDFGWKKLHDPAYSSRYSSTTWGSWQITGEKWCSMQVKAHILRNKGILAKKSLR